jgi:1-acyl-sn-glycerol-3-phosphate acyltransferase
MPNALVVPITINNSWKILRYGKFPLGLGVHILFKVHKPLTTDQLNTPQLIKKVEQIIINDIQHESK